jgi:hypothetical protein
MTLERPLTVVAARAYLLALGAGLLLQGGLSLLLRAAGAIGAAYNGIVTGDVPHGTLHVLWGAAMLAIWRRRPRAADLATVLLVFGVFYSALAVLGLALDLSLGLNLGPKQNAFHAIVGPLALVLGALARPRDRHAPRPALDRP